MEITNNQELKERFVSALREKFSRARVGIHVSDLVYCLREAFFRKTAPEEFTERQLGFFVDGARRHKVLQELLDVESEVAVEKWGVRGSIDMLVDAPLEIKTTRAVANLPDHYFRQLGYYAVLLGRSEGYLVVQRLNSRSDCPWEFYHVVWSRDEITALGDEMRGRATLLLKALEVGDGALLPKVNVSMEWKCGSCLYSERCGKQ